MDFLDLNDTVFAALLAGLFGAVGATLGAAISYRAVRATARENMGGSDSSWTIFVAKGARTGHYDT